MRLGVNAWRLSGQRTGVGRYLLNILRHWRGEETGFERIRVYTSRPLEPIDREQLSGLDLRVLRPDWRMLIWENLRLGPFVDDDVLFCPSYSRPLVCRGRVVVTTHDATQQLHPHLFTWQTRLFYNRLYGWSARRAHLVITDSAAAREDIADCWGVDRDKIRVVHLAAASEFQPLDDTALARAAAPELTDGAPFLLFVGKLSGRRSIPLLLEAFAELKRGSSPHRLVMVGLNVHRLELDEMIVRLGLENDVVYPGYLSDDELNVLYNTADALVSPSIYETVCLPVMEAQAAGAPVICVDTLGMREITDGAALMIERPEVSLMANAMSRIATEPGLRAELSERGLESSRRFSWQRTASETMEILEEASR